MKDGDWNRWAVGLWAIVFAAVLLLSVGYMLSEPPGGYEAAGSLGPLDYWLERYAALIGGMATLVAATIAFFAVRTQTTTIKRHHIELLRRDFGRDFDQWNRHDGSLIEICAEAASQATIMRETLQRAWGGLPDPPTGVLGVLGAAVDVPPHGIHRIRWTVDVESRVRGVSPATTESFRALDAAITAFNQQCDETVTQQPGFGFAPPVAVRIKGPAIFRLKTGLETIIRRADATQNAIQRAHPNWTRWLRLQD